ncbi:MAG: helix-turn-helix domain-containing protein [Dehalococcoidia bacterium]|nr:helix-turn-helix domain-containing protein [Dehalococcoidia bacterium]
MERLLLKPSEVQQELGVGRSKVYEMLACGDLPSVRIGRLFRVSRKALDEWIEQRQNGGG